MCYEYCVAECKLYFCSFLSSSPAPSTWTWTTRGRGCRASSLQGGPVNPQTMAVKLYQISNCFLFHQIAFAWRLPLPPLPWCAACKRLCKGVARRKVGTCCGDPASPCSVNFPPSTLTSSLTQVDPCSILSALWYKP